MIYDSDDGEVEVLDYKSQQVRERTSRWAQMDPTDVANEVMLEGMAKGLGARNPNLNGIAAMLKLFMSHNNIEQGSMIDKQIAVDQNAGVLARMRELQELRMSGKINSYQFNDLMKALRDEVEYAKLPMMEELVAALEREAQTANVQPLVIEHRE